MKKIVITGGQGFLGSRFRKMWENEYVIRAPGSKDLDVTDEAAVLAYMEKESPDYVIHTAGIPNQQFCNDHPDRARAVNVDGALHVAKACNAVDAKMVFTSTEQLFDGSCDLGPYTEESTPVPGGIYAANKWEVEQCLPEILEEYWVVRMTWLFGLPERGCKMTSNILWDTITAVIQGKQIHASRYEFRGMTDVNQICINIEKLFSLPYGTYHFGSVNISSRYEVSEFILQQLSVSPERIKEMLVEDNVKFNADHVRDLRLDTSKIEAAGLHFAETKEAICDCLADFDLKKK